MNTNGSKRGEYSPRSRSGTSRIEAPREELKKCFLSLFIKVSDMAKIGDSAFIPGTLISGRVILFRAGSAGSSPLCVRNNSSRDTGIIGGKIMHVTLSHVKVLYFYKR